MRDPIAGFISQRQTTPVTIKEIAIGKINKLRKKDSPRNPWSKQNGEKQP
jgi:hypothetical protein